MTKLPEFPACIPISLDLQDELQALLAKALDGVSEYTFADLFLFRARYGYTVCVDSGGALIVRGSLGGKKFFETPCLVPKDDVLIQLLNENDYWRCIPKSILEKTPDLAAKFNIELNEDRDNFDYLYLREELATLSGKRFHKKRNLSNAFTLSFPQNSKEPLTKERIADAIAILDRWKMDKGSDGDYTASREAIELSSELSLSGEIFYIKGNAVGYCLGEALAGGTMFAVHFEKAIDEYRGIYQFINQSFANSLSSSYTYINREQDLGDEGLRQAKMTYRPCGFVEKWSGYGRP